MLAPVYSAVVAKSFIVEGDSGKGCWQNAVGADMLVIN
jgi:hypothetical protein